SCLQSADMASSLLPDFSSRPPSTVIRRLSDALLSESSQKPPGGGREMAAPPIFASTASALEAAATTSPAKARRASMASPVIGPRAPKRLDCAKSMGGWFDDAEAVQGQFGVHVREYHLDPRADGDRPVARADKLRGQARAFVELDLHDRVGHLAGKGRKPGFVHTRPRADAPAARRRPPFDLVGKAERAHRPGRQ